MAKTNTEKLPAEHQVSDVLVKGRMKLQDSDYQYFKFEAMRRNMEPGIDAAKAIILDYFELAGTKEKQEKINAILAG